MHTVLYCIGFEYAGAPHIRPNHSARGAAALSREAFARLAKQNERTAGWSRPSNTSLYGFGKDEREDRVLGIGHFQTWLIGA